MGRGHAGDVLRRLDGLFGSGTAAGLGEGPLLERFAARGDEAAFEAIVARHGPMVWSVCRRALRDPNDAEDAFQATFLILARRARSIRRGDRLGGWLHGVAYRVASRARRDLGRRPAPVEDGGPALAPGSDELERLERAELLHEEIARLPARYREPIVLCHLEGCTHDEAAARLGWPVGTVRGRLARGRDPLRDRLLRRGVAGAAVPFARVTVPTILTENTVKAAVGFAAGREAASVISARGAAWVERGLRTMITEKSKAIAWAGLTLATGIAALVVAAGTGSIGSRGLAAEPPAGKAMTPAEPPRAKGADSPVNEVDEALADERDKLEAETDLLQVEVEAAKASLTELIGSLAKLQTEVAVPMPNEDDASRDRRARQRDEHHVILVKKSMALRREYLDGRLRLLQQQRRLRQMDQRLGTPPAGERSIPAALERRLTAIEEELKGLRHAVERGKK